MTLLLLAAGGGLFMTSLNISRGWNVNLERYTSIDTTTWK